MADAGRSEPDTTAIPICVDLDGTLVRTDLLLEAVIKMLTRSPWLAFLLPFWLARGKAYLKQRVFSRSEPAVCGLPYRGDLILWLEQERSKGRTLALATACDIRMAHKVADHLGIFDIVIASDGANNLKGRTKAEELVARFGLRGFDYVGDSRADYPVWKVCRRGFRITGKAANRTMIVSGVPVTPLCAHDDASSAGLLRAMRPYQWVKNILVFVPLVASHRFLEWEKSAAAFWVFAAYCAIASCVYIINDLLDIEHDRRHPEKAKRPFARGDCRVATGIWAAIGLALAGVGLVAVGSSPALPFLILYVAANLAYSFYLKRKALADVFLLSALYLCRILAGGAATGIWPSPWLLSFSGFVFLSIGCSKRAGELRRLHDRQSGSYASGRGYRDDDHSLLEQFGVCSGFLAVMVLALYVNSPDVGVLYRRPDVLWLLCPLVLYWICRLWFLLRRRLIEDPVAFFLRDRVSYITVVAAAAVLWIATSVPRAGH